MNRDRADELCVWQAAAEPANADLLAAAATADPRNVAHIAALRKRWSAPMVHAAVELTVARRKAQAKFPDAAATLIADAEGVEQASSQLVADFKAQRFTTIDGPIIDLCCGIGGDAMSLARLTGRLELAVDIDPVRAWMTRRNAGCDTAVADVTTIPAEGRLFHLDPARRDAGGRRHRLKDYLPGPDFIVKLVRTCRDGAVKMGPGVDVTELPDLGDTPTELQFISEHGSAVQAVLWTGRLARHPRSAALLPSGDQLAGESGHPPANDADDTRAATISPGAMLFVPDPAAERARLLHVLCERYDLVELYPGLGLLTGGAVPTTNWLTAFEVLDVMPWHPDRSASLQRLRDCLQGHGAGIVEVKTRDKAADPDRVQAKLRGKGDRTLTVFILRLGRSLAAMVTRRLPAVAAPEHEAM